MPLTCEVQLFLAKRRSCTKCSLMKDVDDPVSKRALAFVVAPLGAFTLTWQVISRTVGEVFVSDVWELMLLVDVLSGFVFFASI